MTARVEKRSGGGHRLEDRPPGDERPGGDRQGARLDLQSGVVVAALCGLAAVAWTAFAASEARGAQLAGAVGLGALGGVALYHASFGFTGGWRRLQRERRGAGARAQLWLIAAVSLVSFPLIAFTDARGFVAGFGLASAMGAAMFGFGMQIAGGCGSGTLFTVGGGSTRMLLALGGFLAGSVLWTGTRFVFEGWPAFDRLSLRSELGPFPALALTLVALAALGLWTVWLERRRHGSLERARKTGSLWRGPWSLALGGLGLFAVSIGALLVLDRPWGVTGAYPLWGAKITEGVGLPIREWAYWSGARLDQSIFANATSVMNMGIMLGALAAAGLAGRFAPKVRLSFRDAATAIVGGILMGYGARLASGCNIGGLLGGVISGSAHGWWWLLFGALGSVIGVWARQALGQDPPARAAPVGRPA